MNEAKVFPRRLSFSKLCDILIAYLNAGADKEYVGVSEVVNRSNVNLHNISRNNNFLKGWGFIEESEKEPGKYRLNPEGAEFAHAYRIDPNGALTRTILRKLLSKDEALTKFVERVKDENLSRDAVLIELPRVIGDLRADMVGLNAFLDMLNYAFQIMETPTSIKQFKQPRETRSPKYAKKVEKTISSLEVSSPKPNISINLNISPDITPERLKEYVKAMLEAYDEYGQK